MKKAKIMLSAIAVFAVLSGSLAFKAHFKGAQRTYWICSTSGTCISTTTLATTSITTDPSLGEPTLTTFGTTANVQGQSCTITPVASGPCVSPLFVSGKGQ